MLVLRCTYRRADDKAMKRTRHAQPGRRSRVLQGRCRMQRSDREARARDDAAGFKIWGRGAPGLPDVALARGAGRLAPVLLGRQRSGIRYCVAGSMARTGGDRNLRPLERGLLPLQRAGAARPSRNTDTTRLSAACSAAEAAWPGRSGPVRRASDGDASGRRLCAGRMRCPPIGKRPCALDGKLLTTPGLPFLREVAKFPIEQTDACVVPGWHGHRGMTQQAARNGGVSGRFRLSDR